MFEFFGSGADGAAVVGSGDLPQDCVWGAGVDQLRVTDRYVAVDFAMNQQDRDCAGGHGILRRDIFHFEVILQASAEEGNFHERS